MKTLDFLCHDISSCAMNHELPKGMKRPGRPKGPEKVYYRRYVPQDVADAIEAFRKGELTYKPTTPENAPAGTWIKTPEIADSKEVERLRAQNMDLVDQIVALEEKLSAAQQALDEAMMMDLDEKGRMGWQRYYALRDSKVKGEHDQT